MNKFHRFNLVFIFFSNFFHFSEHIDVRSKFKCFCPRFQTVKSWCNCRRRLNVVTRLMWSALVVLSPVPCYIALMTWFTGAASDASKVSNRNDKSSSWSSAVTSKMKTFVCVVAEKISLVSTASLIVHPVAVYLYSLEFDANRYPWPGVGLSTVWIRFVHFTAISLVPGALLWMFVQQPWYVVASSVYDRVCSLVSSVSILTHARIKRRGASARSRSRSRSRSQVKKIQ